MKRLALALVLAALMAGPAFAADRINTDDADIAVKGAQVEALRARASLTPSAGTSAGLLEAEDLLRRLRQTPSDKRPALRSQLDAALARLELEIDAAGRAR